MLLMYGSFAFAQSQQGADKIPLYFAGNGFVIATKDTYTSLNCDK